MLSATTLNGALVGNYLSEWQGTILPDAVHVLPKKLSLMKITTDNEKFIDLHHC